MAASLDLLSHPAAAGMLETLAQVFLHPPDERGAADLPNLDTQYRTLIEQIPAVVFMAYLDRGVGDAYVSPQIESILGFTREEWLEDPIRWYESIHDDDKGRWSSEAAEMIISGRRLRSVYRVIARDGSVISFRCDAKMVRRPDGRPWFLHGVGFDITDLKRAEAALQEERNFATAVLDTVAALVLVLDLEGRIVRINRACEKVSGLTAAETKGRVVWDLLPPSDEIAPFREAFANLRMGRRPEDFESAWLSRGGEHRMISWSGTVLTGIRGAPEYVILTGVDVTEAKRLERAILEVSGREQRRIGQDLHDGLGQHLTGVAFMSKVLEQKLRDKNLEEAADASVIVSLVNQAIDKTREMSHGLLPVQTEKGGLMNALEQLTVQVESLFPIACTFQCGRPALIRDSDVATHLYHIAQEAVNNALKHAHPQRIVVRLSGGDDPSLVVEDDGSGIESSRQAGQGMGLSIMTYRAKMIGGALEVRPRKGGGTEVRCSFPLSNLAEEVNR